VSKEREVTLKRLKRKYGFKSKRRTTLEYTDGNGKNRTGRTRR
jgi:hypothetical protein